MRLGSMAARVSATGRSSVGKDVTRRVGWQWARAGVYVLAQLKCMGIARGETVEVFGVIQIVEVTHEQLDAITASEVKREGFRDLSAADFVARFSKAQHVRPSDVITRVVFEHVDARRDAVARCLLLPAQANALCITASV